MQKILIITGGSHGIGEAVINEYHQHGYTIFSIARSSNPTFTSGSIQQIQYDLSCTEGIEELLQKIFDQLTTQPSGITLINNAATLGKVGRIEHTSAGEVHQQIQLNTLAPIVLTSAFIRYSGRWICRRNIINISSHAAVKPTYGWSVYCSTKAALDMFTKVVAIEQESLENGIKIIAIHPGTVDTEMQATIRSTDRADFKDVEAFNHLKSSGLLADPKTIAIKIYLTGQDENIPNGSIVDLKKMQ